MGKRKVGALEKVEADLYVLAIVKRLDRNSNPSQAESTA